jgi:predicted carbohydrate-binding protein with CBM48
VEETGPPVQRGRVNGSTLDVLADVDRPSEVAHPGPAALTKRPTWAQAEGSPLPLGVTWIEEEQAFNFAVHAEHAESVTLLLYSSTDLVNPLLTFRFDFLLNKSGRIWHAGFQIQRLVRLAITRTPCRDRPSLNFIALTRRRFSSTRTRNAFSSHPALIATWLCGKEQMPVGRLWER